MAPSPCRSCYILFTPAGADATNSTPLLEDPSLKVVRPGRFSSRRAEKERSREDCPYAWPGCRMYVQFRAQGACRLDCIHRHSRRDLSVQSSSVLTSSRPRTNLQRRASTFLRPFPILGRRDDSANVRTSGRPAGVNVRSSAAPFSHRLSWRLRYSTEPPLLSNTFCSP